MAKKLPNENTHDPIPVLPGQLELIKEGSDGLDETTSSSEAPEES